MTVNSNGPIVFFGTPDFAVPSLVSLIDSKRNVSLVVTQPDRPSGRGQKISFSPIKKVALERGISLVQPHNMKDLDFLERLSREHAPYFVVAAFGRILPKAVLDMALPLNVHASLLPRWRGASPIARAIASGDRETGISIIRLTEKLDAGDILVQTSTPIQEEETTGELTHRLSHMGALALLQGLEQLEEKKANFIVQDERQVTLAPPIRVEEARIVWNQKAKRIHDLIRSFNPWPGAFSQSQNQRMKIFRSKVSAQLVSQEKAGTLRIEKNQLWVACSDVWLEILELQREGKSRQTAEKFLPGFQRSQETSWGEDEFRLKKPS